MKKMPCLFQRTFLDNHTAILTREVSPGCEWVLQGEGTASRKWDGTACMIRGDQLFKRYDVKVNPKTGQRKPIPEGSIPCQPEPDPITGHWPHWILVDANAPADRWHREALADLPMGSRPLSDGTYELIGPAINANPEGISRHEFRAHGDKNLDVPRTYEGLEAFLAINDMEGIVFSHPDRRLCKIRRNDFGLPWGEKK